MDEFLRKILWKVLNTRLKRLGPGSKFDVLSCDIILMFKKIINYLQLVTLVIVRHFLGLYGWIMLVISSYILVGFRVSIPAPNRSQATCCCCLSHRSGSTSQHSPGWIGILEVEPSLFRKWHEPWKPSNWQGWHGFIDSGPCLYHTTEECWSCRNIFNWQCSFHTSSTAQGGVGSFRIGNL